MGRHRTDLRDGGYVICGYVICGYDPPVGSYYAQLYKHGEHRRRLVYQW